MSKVKSSSVTGNAARVAAHRERVGRLDVSVPLSINGTILELAQENDANVSEVVRILLRYALTNRDWEKQGLLWNLGGL